MQLSEIRREVQRIIQDESYTEATINFYINETIKYVGQLVKLPGLKRLDSITTVVSANYVPLSSLSATTFSGYLTRVVNSSGTFVSTYPNLESMMDYYISSTNPGMLKAGSVEATTLEGSNLWYQYVPEAAETLTVLYQRDPDILTDDSQTCIHIPEHLHENLLIKGTARRIFEQIEDGIDGEKLNTNANAWHSFNEKNPESGIVKLREYIASRRVAHISSKWDY